MAIFLGQDDTKSQYLIFFISQYLAEFLHVIGIFIGVIERGGTLSLPPCPPPPPPRVQIWLNYQQGCAIIQRLVTCLMGGDPCISIKTIEMFLTLFDIF